MGKETKQKDIFGDTTNKCHYKYDFGVNCKEMINYTRNYLSSFYGPLKRSKLTYHKYSNIDNS